MKDPCTAAGVFDAGDGTVAAPGGDDASLVWSASGAAATLSIDAYGKKKEIPFTLSGKWGARKTRVVIR